MHQTLDNREEVRFFPQSANPLRICLITCFPPSRGDLNEYGFHLASALKNHPGIDLTLLADETASGEELDGFHVQRCWRFNSLLTPARLLRAIRKADPDVVWFNMGFSTFARAPLPAFFSIAGPAITRASGFYTHVTLHTIFERVDLRAAGVPLPGAYRAAGHIATRVLLGANDVTVLLPSFRSELLRRYRVPRDRVHFRPHGTFSSTTQAQLAADPGDLVVLAFGYWGTYKRLESLLECWPGVSQEVPGAKLCIAGLSHPSTPGYLPSLQAQYSYRDDIRFLGYLPENELPSLFRRTSVLVLPYSSAAGTSGVVHQACEHGLPMVAAAIPEIQELAREQDIAVEFYPPGDSQVLKDQLVRLLKSDGLRREMAQKNLSAGSSMQISQVVRGYLELFKTRTHRHRRTRVVSVHDSLFRDRLHHRVGEWFLNSGIGRPEGGVARYYLAREKRNLPVSTEITGYSLSTLVSLHGQTADLRYWDFALQQASFLIHRAWDARAAAMPFEVEGAGRKYSYFFDNGIIVRGLLALWRRSGDNDLLRLAVRCGASMERDFRAGQDFHPILTLPDKRPLPHDKARWSQAPGCYQLKAAMAWQGLSEATGDAHFHALYRQALRSSLDTHLSFLPGVDDESAVMDRLHAYSYFLEGLLPSIQERECRQAMSAGLERLGQFATDIGPRFLRSDVVAQTLRVRLFADQAGVVSLDRERAQHEAALLRQFQSQDADPHLNGGFWFGRKGGEMLPFMNPVSTAFCYDALNLWARYQEGERNFRWQDLI